MTKSYQELINSIRAINPVQYQKTRNFLDGEVTRLSKYITRGAISLPKIKEIILEKYSVKQSFKFIQELAWREYFQRVWQAKGDEIFTDIRFRQNPVKHHNIPKPIIDASTGINLVDEQIQELYETGYLHNHSRMTIASLCCNLGQSHWLMPAKWMYYHLLDGDPASNMLSWQWVAGTSISKKYFVDQGLINYWSKTSQENTFLSFDRVDTLNQPFPRNLEESIVFELKTPLINSDHHKGSSEKDICIYHSFSLNPNWHVDEDVERILLLEPSWFSKMPVSQKVMNSIIEMAKQMIPDITIHVENFESFQKSVSSGQKIYVTDHPSIESWAYQSLNKEEPARLFPEVNGYFKSFSAYWKACKRNVEAW